MRIVGITAEYNPLHTGHERHIALTRTVGRADAIVAVLSSNFVQRGEPAVLDKSARALAAVRAGADLAIELPVVSSCASAGTFAGAAVDIMAATGIIDAVSFGMEDTSADLEALARADSDEDAEFKSELKRRLDGGASYAAARAAALETRVPGAAALLSRPNNSLAIEYAKQIFVRHYNIEMIKIERLGADHNDKFLGGAHPSATAIRRLIASGETDRAAALMPGACAEIFIEELKGGRVVRDMGMWWRIVRAAISRMGANGIARAADAGEGIESRVCRLAAVCDTYEDLLDACQTRRYTRGRIARLTAAAVLGLSRETARETRCACPVYIRPLAANATGRELLRMMKERASVPMVSKAAAHFSPAARAISDLEHLATRMRELCTDRPNLRREAERRPIFIARGDL